MKRSIKLVVPRYDGRGGTVRAQPASKSPKLRFKPGEVVKHDGVDHVVMYAYRLRSDPHEWVYCVEEVSHERDRSELRVAIDRMVKMMRLGEGTPRVVYELFTNGLDASTFFSDIPCDGPSRSNVTNKTLLKQNRPEDKARGMRIKMHPAAGEDVTNDAAVKTVVQCKSCPWRVDCEPDKDIPGYNCELAKGLTRTIQSGIETLFQNVHHVMACHYSKPGEEFACAGWLHNQIGAGNNMGVRLAVMNGRYPVPIVDGEQHENYDDTLPCSPKGPSNSRTATPVKRTKR